MTAYNRRKCFGWTSRCRKRRLLISIKRGACEKAEKKLYGVEVRERM